MKTLVLNGSPRKDGNTAALISKVAELLNGEIRIVDAYRSNISPCIDCRYCWENRDCKIDDGMQEIYEYIEECDNIVIASPIYFSEISGKLLSLLSRVQIYFASRNFRKEELILKSKKGAVILVGGGDGNADNAYETACTVLHHMNCDKVYPLVLSHKTNTVDAVDDQNALEGVYGIVNFFGGEK